MTDPVSTIALALLSLLALVASILAIARLGRASSWRMMRTIQFSLTGVCIIGTALLFCYRAIFVTGGWQPLASHLDGLLLIATLFAATVLFMQRAGIKGLPAFALPLFTIMLAWSLCASAWTYELFAVGSLWDTVHLASVYMGSLFLCIAAAAGSMYLYVQRKLHKHRDLGAPQPMASLEAIEALNIRMATIGFALLTLGLATGLIIVVAGKEATLLGPQWWLQPKIILSAAVWLIYAVVMNVRYATAFRGARAAWLSIIGVMLLIATFSAVVALEKTGEASASKPLTSADVKRSSP